MPLQAPILDDRRFDDLLAEAQQRIVRYAPQWTDFNDSDPGMTLVQLFAWLTEMMLHRLNQVPDRHYIKFLQLLNLELAPALPAQAALTLVPKLDAGEFGSVPPRMQVQAEPESGGDPLIFEASHGMSLVRRPLRSIQVFDGNSFEVIRDEIQTAGRAEDPFSFYPFGFRAEVGSAIYLGFEPRQLEITDSQEKPNTGVHLDADIFPDVSHLSIFRAPAAPQRGAESCASKLAAPPPNVRVVWEYQLADDEIEPRPWRRIDLLRDDSAAFTRDGAIVLRGPRKVALQPRLGKIREPRFWIRCRLESGAYPERLIPEIETVLPNTVVIENLTTIADQFLGESEGVPDQRFELASSPVFRDSLILEITPPLGETTRWERVDDFLASGPDDEHYLLNHNRGEIQFGDGQRGKIPFAASEIIAREYRVGGGSVGNVPAGAISQATLTGVDSVFNYRAAAGGREEQSLDDLKQRAPQVLKSRDRAVTSDDFAQLASQAPGVVEAIAVAEAHPEYPGVDVPGAVTVVIIPDSEAVPPKLRPEVKEQVCAFLNERKLITTELFVELPDFVRVEVAATVVAGGTAASDQVKQQVLNALDDLFNPFSAGARERRRQRPEQDAEDAPVQLGEDFYPSRLFDVMLDVPGVAAVQQLQVRVGNDEVRNLTERVQLGKTQLVYSDRLDISVRIP